MSDIYAGVGADDLVTGEAVALDLPPAGVGLRIVSGVIDLLVVGVILVVAMIIGVISTAGGDAALAGTAVILVIALVFVGVPTLIETTTRGRSVGKLVMGLRTVRDDAGPITFRHAFVRALVGVVELLVFTGVPALVSALVSSKGKRLGDVVAGTYVVRDRFTLVLPAPVAMPIPLAHWAATADIAALPDGLALAVRQFLGRALTLNPASRELLARDLADRVSRYAAPAPPPGTPPEAFLAAVLAERRNRDAARLGRESQLRRRLTSIR